MYNIIAQNSVKYCFIFPITFKKFVVFYSKIYLNLSKIRSSDSIIKLRGYFFNDIQVLK